MTARLRFALLGALALPLAALAGCAGNVGPDGRLIGGPCFDEFSCVTGAFCLRRASFPDGTCTTNCLTDADCRGDTVCIEVEGGVCLLACDVDDDCGRVGYSCGDEIRRGEAGSVLACRG